jgi:hypothetical protein
MNQIVLKLGLVFLTTFLSMFSLISPLNGQTVAIASKTNADPIEFLKARKCWFKGKGYSNYSVGYIVRSYVSAGRINNLKWAKTPMETLPQGWIVTLSYFDTQKGKNGEAHWSFDLGKGRKAVVEGNSENKFLSCVPGEKYTHWPGANQMDVIE